eukprot:scaffold10191_cov283-Chaetoceros_neogracile.AAC.2
MTAICLCGVCVPYSAIIPLLLVLLQFIARPLYQMGLLPDILAKKLGVHTTANMSNINTNTNGNTKSCCDSDCNESSQSVAGRMESSVSNSTTDSTCSSGEDKDVVEVTSMAQFQVLLKEKNTVFLKFTADWCKPCKAIHPFYQSLSEKNASNKVVFATVDVDEVDDLAAQYKIAMMPTFVAIVDKQVVQQMSGANKNKLESFVKKVLS